MPAYGFALVEEVMDQAGLMEYVGKVVPLAAKYGGQYIITSFAVTPLEGSLEPVAAAVIQFPNAEKLREFWDCAEYQPLVELRQRSARVNIVMVDAET
ncbi:MAG TPA: DUF1330 domain-containing protein [Longimicrobiales bacterium]